MMGSSVSKWFCLAEGPKVPAAALYCHAGGLGNLIAPSDEDGQVKRSYTYDAPRAATIWNTSDGVAAQSGEGNRVLFTGHEWFEETFK